MAAETGSIKGRRYVTMRFKRIKTWSHAYHVRRHNTREMECHHLEAGAPKPELLIGTADISGSIRRVMDDYGVKPRKGAVLALEFVVSTSREVFDDLSDPDRDDRIRQLTLCTLRAFRARFRVLGQIVSMALHLDERTPHIHLVVVPLIRDEGSNRVRLSAKEVIGGRGDMAREQTRFARFFAEMGLERGAHRSGARHISNREHEASLEGARQAALSQAGALASDRDALTRERSALHEAAALDQQQLDQRESAIAEREAQLLEEIEQIRRSRSELEEQQKIVRQIWAAADEDRKAAAAEKRAVTAAKTELARSLAMIRTEQGEARQQREAAEADRAVASEARQEAEAARERLRGGLTTVASLYRRAKDLQSALKALPPIQRPSAGIEALQRAAAMSREGAKIAVPDVGLDAATIAAFQRMQEMGAGR